MRDDCTVLCCSCDKYVDVLSTFVRLFRRFWTECPFELALVTETDSHLDGFDRVIACGTGKCWSEMLVEALDKISTPYVMLLMDDYFLEASVDHELVLRRLEQMKRLNAANLRLIPNPRGGHPIEDLLEYPKNIAYCVSCQTGFWAKDYLRGIAVKTKSAWEFERYGSFMVGEEKRPILHTAEKEFPFVDAVHKGCWEKSGIRICRDNGIEIDFSKRGLPTLRIRLIEFFKAAVFAIFPHTMIVRIQNAFDIGAKEIRT